MIEIIIKGVAVSYLFDTLELSDDPICEEIRVAAKKVPGLMEFCEKLDETQTPMLVDYALKEAAELLVLLKAAAA
jgi:hypothetical protein